MTKDIEIVPIYYDYILANEKHYPVIVLVGGRNSGKSFFLEQLATINTHSKKNYKLVVVEDVETNVGAGVKDGILKRTEEFGLDSLYESTKNPAEIHHKVTGSEVLFRGYRTEEQQKRFKSLNEVTAVWYEEAEKITLEQFKALRMQLRGGDAKDRQLFLSLNPINEDGFVNQEFFLKTPHKVFERFADGRPKVFEHRMETDVDGKKIAVDSLVIVTTYKDNPYLTDEQRAEIEALKDYDEDMYKMLALGMFVKPQGAFFKEFQQGVHTCEPFIIPQHWRRYRTMDYGLDMLACYWVAMSDGGKSYVYKELYESDLVISDAAAKIKAMTTEPIQATFAPPDLWNRRQETGRSAAEIFYANGVPLYKANNNREQGWLDLKEHLKPYADEQGVMTANLVIFDTCTNLIRTLPQLMRDKNNPNDVDGKTNHELTHAPDAIRYYVTGRPTAYKAPKARKLDNNAAFANYIFTSKPARYADEGEITVL